MRVERVEGVHVHEHIVARQPGPDVVEIAHMLPDLVVVTGRARRHEGVRHTARQRLPELCRVDVHRQHFGKLRQSCSRGVVGAELDPAHVGDTADLTFEVHPLRWPGDGIQQYQILLGEDLGQLAPGRLPKPIGCLEGRGQERHRVEPENGILGLVRTQQPLTDGSPAGLYGALDLAALEQGAAAMHHDLKIAPGAHAHCLGKQLAVLRVVIGIHIRRRHVPFIGRVDGARREGQACSQSRQPFHRQISHCVNAVLGGDNGNPKALSPPVAPMGPAFLSIRRTNSATFLVTT